MLETSGVAPRNVQRVILLAVACMEQVGQRPVSKDPGRPIEARVQDVLKRMTLEEKTAQMVAPGR